MMFYTPIEMFYSRRIGSFKDLNNYNIEIPTVIDYAIKLSGKENNGFSYGLISASTKNEVNDTLSIDPYIENNTYNIMRFKQDILDGNSFIGFMATSYDGLRGTFIKNEDTYTNNQDASNVSNYSIDSKLNFLDNRLQSNFQLAQTKSGQTGQANFLSVNYNFNEYWSGYISYDYIDEYFDNNDIGYTKRNDIESKDFEITYHDFNPNSRFIESKTSLGFSQSNSVSKKYQLKNLIFLENQIDFINNQSIAFGFYKSYNVYDDRLLFDYKDNLLSEQSIFTPSSNTFYIGWESDLRNINSFMVGLSYKTNKIKDDRYIFTYNQTYRPQHDIKISFDYIYKYGYKKYHWLETTTDDSENLHHIFSNKDHNEQKYTIRFDAFLSKNITLQSYTEFIRTNHQFSNWTELLDGATYPEETNFTSGIALYANENEDPDVLLGQHPHPNNDPFFFSKYNELIYNLVLKWEFNPRSDLYLVYTRYWFVNGKSFKSFLDFLDYSGKDPWIESSFDQGITVKYSYQFDI